MVHVLKTHIIRILMELYASSYIHFLCIFIFLDMRVSYIKANHITRDQTK
jgi:hypothetical protein